MLADDAVGSQGKGKRERKETSFPAGTFSGIFDKAGIASAHPDERKRAEAAASGPDEKLGEGPGSLSVVQACDRVMLRPRFQKGFPFMPLLRVAETGEQMDVSRPAAAEQIDGSGQPENIASAVNPPEIPGIPQTALLIG